MPAEPHHNVRSEDHLAAILAADTRRRIAVLVKKLERYRRSGVPAPQELLDDLADERATLQAARRGERAAKPVTPRPLTGREARDAR